MEGNRLGDRIRAFRKLKGWTQVSFAERSGVSLSTLGEWERGNRSVSEVEIDQLCRCLGVSKAELLNNIAER